MAWVFTTSVSSASEARKLAPGLNLLAGPGQWNFDLDDCDKILRVIAPDLNPERVVQLLASCGVQCEELNDFIPLAMEEKHRLTA